MIAFVVQLMLRGHRLFCGAVGWDFSLHQSSQVDIMYRVWAALGRGKGDSVIQGHNRTRGTILQVLLEVFLDSLKSGGGEGNSLL